jgi:Tol biopolymer transport system component
LFHTIPHGDDFRGNLYSIRPDGTGLRELTHFRGRTKVTNGSYSPDGLSIVFSTIRSWWSRSPSPVPAGGSSSRCRDPGAPSAAPRPT